VDLIKAVMCAIKKRVPRITQLHEYAKSRFLSYIVDHRYNYRYLRVISADFVIILVLLLFIYEKYIVYYSS